MNKYFVRRSHCPGCQSPERFDLVKASLTKPPLLDYLLSFYAAQGGVDLEYLHEQDYVLSECLNCGLIYQQEIPGEWLLHKLYEEWIDPTQVFESIERRRPIGYFSGLGKEVISIVRHFDCLPSELRFLDFGMGWGHWCRIAQALGCEVYGMEVSAPRINYARQTGIHVIDYEEIATLRFDFINTEQVIEHLAEPRKTIDYLRQSLKSGGILKISVPDGADVKQKLKRWNWQAPKASRDSLNPVAPLEHINCFNRDVLVRVARDLSLEPIDYRSFQGNMETVQRLIVIFRRHWNRFRRNQVQPSSIRLFFRAVDLG